MADKTQVPVLPEKFTDRMKELLKDDYPAFEASFSLPRTYGLRVNTSRISPEEFEQLVPFPVRKIPWIPGGYFYDEGSRPSRCPLYQAGLYYLQDPGAMTPGSRLPVQPGEWVLDLCAAPGGKASALADRLDGTGLLVANDISASRARILLHNLELSGTMNAFVTNETPERLLSLCPELFDKVLLDAPCSGEGMFRKEEALLKDWSPEKSRELSRIQKNLLLKASDMLRPGGMLLYSTCTFSSDENEEAVLSLLEARPGMRLVPVEGYEGFTGGLLPARLSRDEAASSDSPADLRHCVRILPHRMEGEGHFLALFKKEGGAVGKPLPAASGQNSSHALSSAAGQKKSARLSGPERQALSYIKQFFSDIGASSLGGQPFSESRIEIRKDKVYYLPPVRFPVSSVVFLRNGLLLGDLKKDRFEPSVQLALAFRKGEVRKAVDLSVSDERLNQYLSGAPVPLSDTEVPGGSGWHLLTVSGFPLAFGKVTGRILKNKYPAGWRI